MRTYEIKEKFRSVEELHKLVEVEAIKLKVKLHRCNLSRLILKRKKEPSVK